MPEFYICDPDKNTECSKTNCCISGGSCLRTMKPAYAQTDLSGMRCVDTLHAMINKQVTLQNALGYTFSCMTPKQRAEYIFEYERHMTHEVHEMLQELPYFKAWKKYSTSDEANAVAFAKARAEWIDVLHFFLNISIALGFTADEMFAMYCNKNGINYDRQKDTTNYKKCMEEQ